MSQLSDLEKLKQEVTNLKQFLIQFTRMTYLIYEDLDDENVDWEQSKQKLLNRYKLMDGIGRDFLFNNINGYYNEFFNEGTDEIELLAKMKKKEQENFSKHFNREEFEKDIMRTKQERQQNSSVSKGGKTRKNRKSRK